MENKVLEILKEYRRPLGINGIYRRLGKKVEREILRHILESMVERQLIRYAGKATFVINRDNHLIQGEIQKFPAGFGFLLKEGGDIFIPGYAMKGARNGDIVLIRMRNRKRGKKQEGEVVKIVERKHNVYTGSIFKRNGRYYIEPDDLTLPQKLRASGKGKKKEWEGKRVSFYMKGNIAVVKRILGYDNETVVDLLTVIERYELPEHFTKKMEQIASRLKTGQKENRLRKNLEKEFIFTIDPENAKDFDDAISVRRTKDMYTVGIHIADVSAYVKENSLIDIEALKRGTSVYLFDKVIPMLPEHLSNNLCSLNPGVKRLAVSVILQLDKSGNIISSDFFPSIIESKARLSYKLADAILKGKKIPENSPIKVPVHIYEKVSHALALADEVADILTEQREQRGSIDFDLPEPEILFTDSGNIAGIQQEHRLKTQKIVEEFMILANRAVARFLSKKKVPTIYRVHDAPKLEKLNIFSDYYKMLTGGKIQFDADLHKELNSAISKIRDEKKRKLVSYLLLRSLMKARYSTENTGHFGLALSHYLHFTSPIRRYPDLVVHRTLKSTLSGTPRTDEKYRTLLANIAELSSKREEIAQRAEWDLRDFKILNYLQEKVGEVFDGVIINIIESGMFVNLVDFYIDGFVPFSAFNSSVKIAEGGGEITLNGNTTLYLGNDIRVKIVKVDKWKKRLDLFPA